MSRKAPGRPPTGGSGVSSARDVDRDVEAIETAVSRAREVLSDLREERRALADLRSDLRRMLETGAEELVERAVKEQVGQLAKVTETAMDDAVRRVHESFEKLANLFLGRGTPNAPQLEELAVRARAARSPLFAADHKRDRGKE